jgi:3-keto-L-gulonate-6-phosphate decarboxylase
MAQRLARRICAKCKTVDTGNAVLREYFHAGADESSTAAPAAPTATRRATAAARW